ncbi:hypothetical protein H1C71_000150, partial [Ictidomys tridecemlineatus]
PGTSEPPCWCWLFCAALPLSPPDACSASRMPTALSHLPLGPIQETVGEQEGEAGSLALLLPAGLGPSCGVPAVSTLSLTQVADSPLTPGIEVLLASRSPVFQQSHRLSCPSIPATPLWPVSLLPSPQTPWQACLLLPAGHRDDPQLLSTLSYHLPSPPSLIAPVIHFSEWHIATQLVAPARNPVSPLTPPFP